MKFVCELCNYSTDVKFAYQKHIKSIRHTKKVEEQQVASRSHLGQISETSPNKDNNCPYCDKYYSTAGNLARHKKICTEKQVLENIHEQKISELQKELQHLKEMNELLKGENTTVKNDNSYLKTLINNAGAVIKTSVSALAYVTKNYTDAPKLQKLEDYTYLEYNDNNDEFDLVAIVISQYQTKLLCQYLGDIIINAYKRDDPSEQSIWNSDSVRLTYLIRDIINKKTDWTVDKKGVKTTKYIIDPLLEYIKDLLNKYIDENGLEHHYRESYMKFKKRTDDMNAVAEIIRDIANNILSDQILKYIAPHFYLTKNDNDVLINI